MGSRRKTFVCGHKGFGAFCHRCAEAERARQAGLQARKAAREAERAQAAADPVDLAHIHREDLRRVRAVLARMGAGARLHELGGKRLQQRREVISIPVGRGIRILCREEGNMLCPIEVLTHEDYNTAIAHLDRLSLPER